MKPIVVIISIYFLLLAVLPCHCGIIDRADFLDTTPQVVCLHSDNDANHDLDICTPFCSCANIHYPNFITQDSIEIESTKITSFKQYSIYKVNDTCPFSGSLWRPPQA